MNSEPTDKEIAAYLDSLPNFPTLDAFAKCVSKVSKTYPDCPTFDVLRHAFWDFMPKDSGHLRGTSCWKGFIDGCYAGEMLYSWNHDRGGFNNLDLQDVKDNIKRMLGRR